MCQVHGAGSKVLGTKYEVRDTRHKIRDTWYVVRGTLAESVRRSHAKIEIMYLTRELVGSKPPCQKGAGGGCKFPLLRIYTKME